MTNHPLVSIAALLGGLLPIALPGQDKTPAPPAPYVAHEWGTFTSMVGTDGVVLEGLHREEEHLPGFVHDLMRTQAFGVTDDKLPASRVTQKMETPVIYFHADTPQRVRVDVWFRDGLMTQFYPLPNEVYPQLDAARKQRLDMSTVRGSRLVWDVDVLPRSGPAPDGIPVVGADDPWSFARQTSACWVRTRPGAGSPARAEAEHYLFYRGLGRWQPPVTLQVAAGGDARLHHTMAQPIPFALALELGGRGARFTTTGALAPETTHHIPLGRSDWRADRERVAREVGAVVMQALVQQGLYLDEARAMVATWSRSWFQKDGARIVYLLPRAAVDEVLPLQLEPRPRELVRVLVGRLEFITPAVQQEVEQALVARGSSDHAAVAAAERVLLGLDRFLEPQLRNIERCGSTPQVRRAAAALRDARCR